MAKDIGGNRRQRAAAVWHLRERNLERSICRGLKGGRRIRDDSYSPPRDRLLDVAIAVGSLTLHGDEERARLDAARVVFNTTDENILTHTPQNLGAAECFIQVYRGRHRAGILSPDANLCSNAR